MRRLVLAHEEKRLGRVAIAQPRDRRVADEVGAIALAPHAPRRREELRVVVAVLPRQDLPVIEAGRLADEVPLADHRRGVARRLQRLGHRPLAAVKGARVVDEAVGLAVQPRENGRAARTAQ